MSKHTPGPWYMNYAGGAGKGKEFQITEYFVYAPDTQDDVGICGDVIDPLTQRPSEANARLIAAAPDLLAALMNYVDGCSSSVDAAAVARAAISKATRAE